MKTRILLTLLVLIIETSINAQNVSIPDTNFKNYLVGNTLINTNGDTEIQVSEASAFTGIIDCYLAFVSDATGIEAFTSLTELYFDDNAIISLDLSNNSSLIRLNCSGNALTSLNIANGNNSNFTFFRASNNPNLTCIQVDDVTYSTSNWTQIDPQTSFSTNCNAPCIVTIPDAIFKAFLVSDPTINTNGDTEIQCSEATAFSGPINLYNKSISDLTGIEAFVNMEHLSCVKNNLTSIDVSNNTALLTLHVNDNALTDIDVSNNLLLETFQCTDNAITYIDVTANTALTNFACSDNPINTLYVTKNTALTEFWCMNNGLTTLDVSNNTALTYFSCYGNALTSLDMSNNTALGTIYCDNNALTSLNMANGNNANLTSGNFSATGNPDLACVQVDDVAYSTTNWTSIDSATSFSTNCSGTTGIVEMVKQDVNIYPNPVQNELFIELENVQITEAIILDLSGKVVQSMASVNSKSINVSVLKQGVYFLKIQTETNSFIKRFVKQ